MTTEEKTYELVPYKVNETTTIEVSMAQEDLWLTQKQIAELFDTTVQNISAHIINIFGNGELVEKEVIKKNLKIDNHAPFKTAKDSLTTNYYNLDMIISVGYRVNSKRGIAFRKWATGVIKDRIFQEKQAMLKLIEQQRQELKVLKEQNNRKLQQLNYANERADKINRLFRSKPNLR